MTKDDLNFINGELNQALIDLERARDCQNEWQKRELFALTVAAINNAKSRLNYSAKSCDCNDMGKGQFHLPNCPLHI